MLVLRSLHVSRVLPLGLLYVAGVLPAVAQTADAPPPDAPPEAEQSHWAAGLGVGTATQPYRGVENKTRVMPVLMYANGNLRVMGPAVDYRLVRNGPLEIGINAAYRPEGFKAGDSAYLAGMSKRIGSVWVGTNARLHTPLVNLFGELSADAAGRSDGVKLKLGAVREWRLGPFGLSAGVGAELVNAAYGDYYYGVSAAEATATRAQYSGRATVNVDASLKAFYPLAPQQMLTLDLGARRLGSGIADSPIVSRRTTTNVGVGYLYRF